MLSNEGEIKALLEKEIADKIAQYDFFLVVDVELDKLRESKIHDHLGNLSMYQIELMALKEKAKDFAALTERIDACEKSEGCYCIYEGCYN